jgi:4-hydroxy-3-methylbut-2-enyl diphosphate reductase
MSTPTAAAAQKVNLRRPDIMSAVQAQVLSHYRSELVERIRANGHIVSTGDLTIKLAKEFGFCYGVERAIDLAYAARRAYPDRLPSEQTSSRARNWRTKAVNSSTRRAGT